MSVRLAALLNILPEQTQINVGERALRLLGGKRLIGADTTGPYLALSGEPGDLAAVLARTRDMRSWIEAWRDAADTKIAASGLAASGAARVRLVRTACIYLAFANQGHSFADIYRDVSRHLVATHALIHSDVTPAYERIEIALGDDSVVRAIVRIPASEQALPVVVICQGLERVKEQAFQLEDALLSRGIAVINVDQPGVGETLARGVDIRSAARVDAFASALGEYCRHARRLDASRIGVYGHSMGGATALAISAVLGARATATLAAPVVLAIDRAPAIFRRRARWAAGVDSNAAFTDLMRSLDIPGRIRRIDTPVMALHGSADTVVPLEQVYEIAARAPGPVRVRVFPRGDHTCSQYSAAVWSAIADFMAAELGAPSTSLAETV